MLHSSVISFGTAILMGLGLGYVLQRGRFCLNSAFRDIIFIQDLTLFRAYLLSVVVAIIGSNLIEDLGFLQAINPDTGALEATMLMRQTFVPVANILGGFLFGLGIVLAGGCASGIVYRIGEGQLSALTAIIGFFFGAVMTADGLLSPVNNYLKNFRVEINGTTSPAIWDLFGGGPALKWLTIAIFSIGVLTFVFAGKPEFKSKSKGFASGTVGLLIGGLTILGWWISSYFGGAPRGMSVSGPVREFFYVLLTKSTHSSFPEFSFLGIFRGSWGMFFILAVPFGAWISAFSLKEFKWKIPPAAEFLTVLFGSILMGIGAVIAGGCNLGHGITGMSTGAVSSLVAITAIILGNWTMVYFKLIRPMQD
ncbi:MAG TPA: YeeE/YedE family protein [Nitrospirota bacterium]